MNQALRSRDRRASASSPSRTCARRRARELAGHRRLAEARDRSNPCSRPRRAALMTASACRSDRREFSTSRRWSVGRRSRCCAGGDGTLLSMADCDRRRRRRRCRFSASTSAASGSLTEGDAAGAVPGARGRPRRPAPVSRSADAALDDQSGKARALPDHMALQRRRRHQGARSARMIDLAVVVGDEFVERWCEGRRT